MQVPNGELTSEQLRFLGDCIAKYGADGCADITTRANIQLRGVQLEDADAIMAGLVERGLSSVMSGMDNVRNITGSPIAGIDPHELVDTRRLCHGERWAHHSASFATAPCRTKFACLTVSSPQS